MDAKSGSDFEKPEVVDGRREERMNSQALRKSSQKFKPNRYKSTQRNVSAIDALRAWAKENKQSHYSIYSLSEVLFCLGHDNLTQWRYANKVKTAFYQLALRELEQAESNANKPDADKLRLVPFVLNLSHSLQQKMVDSKRKEVICCKDKITRSLEAALGRTVEFWFQYEMAPKAHTGKPHIQGAMLISMNEMKLARRAFHKVNGRVEADFKRHAIRFRLKKRYEFAEQHGLLYADLNWASYCAKETGRVRLSFVDQESSRQAKLVAVSRSLNSKTMLIYDELRSLLQNGTQQLVIL